MIFAIILLSLALVVACVKWITWKISSKAVKAAFIRYLKEKSIELPDPDTFKTYQSLAIENIVKEFFHSR